MAWRRGDGDVRRASVRDKTVFATAAAGQRVIDVWRVSAREPLRPRPTRAERAGGGEGGGDHVKRTPRTRHRRTADRARDRSAIYTSRVRDNETRVYRVIELNFFFFSEL